jgi:hypothetical protein
MALAFMWLIRAIIELVNFTQILMATITGGMFIEFVATGFPNVVGGDIV